MMSPSEDAAYAQHFHFSPCLFSLCSAARVLSIVLGTYRSLWDAQYEGVDAIMYVVDSSDRIRMAVARDELENLLKNKFVIESSK